jgi:hypothetical protein
MLACLPNFPLNDALPLNWFNFFFFWLMALLLLFFRQGKAKQIFRNSEKGFLTLAIKKNTHK